MSKAWFLFKLVLADVFRTFHVTLLALQPWLVLGATLAGVFILVIFIRITVPRFRVETLSRLGWANLLGYLALVVGAYLLGFFCG